MHTNSIIALCRILGLFALLQISSCNRDRYIPEIEDPRTPCKVLGSCDAAVIKKLKRFNRGGIKIITIGQDYLISIPAARLFNDQSPRLKWGAYPLLNEIASFIKQFRKIAINVTGYSSKYVSMHRELALTTARARVVGEYLWSQGIDSRFVFTQGLGSDKPITQITQGGDASPNARIEITFRDAVA